MSDRRLPAVFIAIALSVCFLGNCGNAKGSEQSKAEIAACRRAISHFERGPFPFYYWARMGDMYFGFLEELQDIPSVQRAGTEPHSPGDIGFNVRNTTLAQDVIVRKIDSEEFTLEEGVTVHAVRSSTLQRGVNLSRSMELLVEGGVEGGISAGFVAKVKADIGVRVANTLGNELQQAQTTESIVELNGDVLESARVEWYGRIRRGKAVLEVNGVARELPFEYILSFFPKQHTVPRRRSSNVDERGVRTPAPIVNPAADPLLPRFGRVTAVSKEWPRLFEARFETPVNPAKGDKLPMYRGTLDAKCIGVCKVIAVEDCRIVAECEGFTPMVGDTVSGGDTVVRGLR
jgi:hypothetical protein